MLQYYSALPFNITAGCHHDPGHAARPTVNGAFISRNAGSGFDLFNVNARLSRAFSIGERVRLEAIAEAFNLLNHLNGVTLNGTFGTGAYPDESIAGVQADHRGGGPENAPVCAPPELLG